MGSFLLSSAKRRLSVCGAVAVVLVLALCGFLILASVDDWREASVAQKKWMSGQREKCESLFDRTSAEIKAIDAGRCSFDKGMDQYWQCKDAEKERRERLIDTASRSDCPAISLDPGALPILLPPGKSSSLPGYALESRRIHPPALPAGMLALTVLLFVLSDMGRRLVLETHVGWRRLSVVAVIAVTASVAGRWLYDGEDTGETLAAGLAALACSSLAVVYGRAVFLWVADGFGKTAGGDRNMEKGIPTPTDSAVAPSFPSVATDPVPPGDAVVSVPAADSVSWKPATFWPRFWARCLDLPLCWVLGSIPGAFIPDIRSAVGGPFGIVLDVFAGMAVICLAVFLYEAFFVSRFGATPGKMLFGLQVRSVDDRPPSWEEAKRRGWSYLKSGLYLTFYLPVLQILGAVMAWRRRDGSQPWDMAGRTHVRQKPVGMLRFALAVLVSFLVVSTMVVSHKMLKEGTKEDIRRSVLD